MATLTSKLVVADFNTCKAKAANEQAYAKIDKLISDGTITLRLAKKGDKVKEYWDYSSMFGGVWVAFTITDNRQGGSRMSYRYAIKDESVLMRHLIDIMTHLAKANGKF